MTTLLVDAANVVGSRPDGWWRDRAGATARLLARLAALRGPAEARYVPDELAAALRVVRLPEPLEADAARAVERRLLAEHRIEVPLMGTDLMRYVRLSAHVYNGPDDYDRLARALPAVLAR
jgi:selenocysteine lyase/cysteine desulfurase